MPRKRGERMVMISVHLPQSDLEALDKLVEAGVFPNRAEALREAIRLLLLKYSPTHLRR